MHVHSFQHLHIVERSRMTIEQHALVTLVLALGIILGVGHALSLQSDDARTFPFTEVSEAGIRLSRFADQQYAHETAAREQAMIATLDALRRDLQADRAYIAVYGVTEDVWVEYQVIHILEATKTGVTPDLQRLHGIGRSSWLQMEENTYRAGWLSTENLPKIYGMELDDEHGMPVGYLGIENTQEDGFIEQDIQLLREAARSIEAALLRPLEYVNTLKEPK
ncbi:hypothetical protein U27_05334 [Candidatus Vecturithrix granuli]|uniref:Uncharacterized protein n=1 Tax=Vecturithrix granuli TaxID=1499967 RepID=A0A081C1A5_VECG1|nr:hypothetical protein U27_05334 [Candidatus Vecturithrix granuli]